MLERQVELPETKRVGDMLQQHRVRSGFDLAEVSGYLHIRRGYLEAIEQSRFDLLPGPAYAAGFVRAYAGFLGFDADAMVDCLRRETGTFAAPIPLHSRAPVAAGNAPRAGVVLMGRRSRCWPTPAGTCLPRVAPTWRTSRPPWIVRSTRTTRHRRGRRRRRSWRAAAPTALPAEPAAPAASAGPAPTTALAAEPPDGGLAAPAAASSRIVLRAKADSWVEVRDTQTNSVLIGRLLRSGEAYAVPDRPGLRLITGDAGGLLVYVDGNVVPSLGKDGAFMGGVGLDPDALRRLAASSLTQ
ncbi:MAG: helix-turn-helix domain-containing protein [Rhodospirillales bacterium]